MSSDQAAAHRILDDATATATESQQQEGPGNVTEVTHRPTLRLVTPAQTHAPDLSGTADPVPEVRLDPPAARHQARPLHPARHQLTRTQTLREATAITGLILIIIATTRTALWLLTHGHTTSGWVLTSTLLAVGLIAPPMWALDGAPALARARARRCAHPCCASTRPVN